MRNKQLAVPHQTTKHLKREQKHQKDFLEKIQIGQLALVAVKEERTMRR